MEEISENIKTPVTPKERARDKGKLYRAQLRLALAMVPLVTVAACVTAPPADVVEYNQRVNEAMRGGDGQTSVVQGSESVASQSTQDVDPNCTTNTFTETSNMTIPHDKVGVGDLNKDDPDTDGDGYTDKRGHRVTGPDGQFLNPSPPDMSLPKCDAIGTAPQAPLPSDTLHQGNEQGQPVEGDVLYQGNEVGSDGSIDLSPYNQPVNQSQETVHLDDDSIDLSPYNQTEQGAGNTVEQPVNQEISNLPEIQHNNDLASRKITFRLNSSEGLGKGTGTIISMRPIRQQYGILYDTYIVSAWHAGDTELSPNGMGPLPDGNSLMLDFGSGAIFTHVSSMPTKIIGDQSRDIIMIRATIAVPESNIKDTGQVGLDNISPSGIIDGEPYTMISFPQENTTGIKETATASYDGATGLVRVDTEHADLGSSGAGLFDSQGRFAGICIQSDPDFLNRAKGNCIASPITKSDIESMMSALE